MKNTRRHCFKSSKAFAELCDMPQGLHHAHEDGTFDPESSEVLRWIASRPTLLLYLKAKAREDRAIVYDPETKTWAGANFLKNAPFLGGKEN
jgi:hypothetical protein